VLSAHLVGHLEKMAEGDSGMQVAYFFFDDKEDKQKSAASCLSSLIHQMIVSAPVLIEHATRFYIAQKEQMAESVDTLWKIFATMASDPIVRGRYVVLDALDECEEESRSAFLDRLRKWYTATASTSKVFFKVLTTSRPNNISALLWIDLNQEERNATYDIKCYVADEVDKLKYQGGFREKVSIQLEQGAGTMFSWASLVIETLKDTPTENVLETLEQIPPGITGLYTHLLGRIPPRSVLLAKLILMNVVHASRQMSILELAIACTIKDTHTSLSGIARECIDNFEDDIK